MLGTFFLEIELMGSTPKVSKHARLALVGLLLVLVSGVIFKIGPTLWLWVTTETSEDNYTSGSLLSRHQFKRGTEVRHGLQIMWWGNGAIAAKAEYSNG